MSVALAADRGELQRFVDATFAYADRDSFVSLRCFRDDIDGVALRDDWRSVRVTGNADDLVDAAEDLATLAAIDAAPTVFAPPVCTFKSADKADAANIANGLVITAELDSNPGAGRARLEAVLGPATVAVKSGGLWLDPETGQELPKLHLHWRLEKPTRTAIEHDFLKEANRLATTLAGGDPTAVPLVHPLRWAGSWHRKVTPRMACIVDGDIAREINLAEALGKLREAVKAAKPKNGHDPAPHKDFAAFAPAELLDITAAIACIPNDDRNVPAGASWKQWNDMGLRIYAATNGSDVGLALFIDWSKRSKAFNEPETRARWQHYATSPPTKTNAGASFNLAKQHYKDFLRPSELRKQVERDADGGNLPWPKPIGPDAYHGVIGDFVNLVEPHTEADPAALMFQYLAAIGNALGDKAWAVAERTRHYPALYALIVGDTAKARKGTSMAWVIRAMAEAAPAWRDECTTTGLSTGEGLIERVRDPEYERNKKTGEMELVHPGVKDKRLLVTEQEFSKPLRAMGRRENTLAAVLRSAWDGIPLGLMTRNRPIKATGATISMIGHITVAELRDELAEVHADNGLANRLLFVAVTRSKLLPLGGNLSDGDLTSVALKLGEAIKSCPAGRVGFDKVAERMWIDVYPQLSAAAPGIFGAVTARSEAQVLRVALIYALLDGQRHIGKAHLAAALEIIRYANDSALHIFGDATGNPAADTILAALRATPGGLTRSEINYNLFHRNARTDDIGKALALLVKLGKAYVVRTTTPGPGRPVEIWKAA